MKRLHEFERKQIISIAKKYQMSCFSIGMLFKKMKSFNDIRNHLSLTLSLVVSKRTPISHLRN